MIKIENVEIYGWEAAIRGMRNPMNSWEKSDSKKCIVAECSKCQHYNTLECNKISPDDIIIGENDLALMRKLAAAGSVHGKYRRMITVTLDITAPLYWWKEFDTYKVGTVRNSCSTMHKIHSKKFELDDFSHEKLINKEKLKLVIDWLNEYRNLFNNYNSNAEFKDLYGKHIEQKDFWWQIIQLLPSSYNQRATVQLNYEVLAGMYHWRKDHKLDEWREFCRWIESLPYSELITGKTP